MTKPLRKDYRTEYEYHKAIERFCNREERKKYDTNKKQNVSSNKSKKDRLS